MPEEKQSPIKFPCDFMIKVMGKANNHFEKRVLSLFQEQGYEINNDNLVKRYSKDHNYLALSITVHVNTKEQLDTLYYALSSDSEIIMAL